MVTLTSEVLINKQSRVADVPRHFSSLSDPRRVAEAYSFGHSLCPLFAQLILDSGGFPIEMSPVFNPDGDASRGERLWASCKYLTVLWCCPCQMSALNNSDYTSHSLHSWSNGSMWHLDRAAALVSFWEFPFEGCFFFFGDINIVCCIFHTQQHQSFLSSINAMQCEQSRRYSTPCSSTWEGPRWNSKKGRKRPVR